MIATGAAAAFNHLLEHDGAAREQLAAHAGARIEVLSTPFPALRLMLLPEGLFSASGSPSETEPADLTITIHPLAMPLLALNREQALRSTQFVGSEPLAEVMRGLMRSVRWDVEEDLSRLVGDVAAHRAVQTSRQVMQWQREAGERLARNFSEYWTEEQPLLARRGDVDTFTSELRNLQDRLDRLEEHLERLPARTGPAA